MRKGQRGPHRGMGSPGGGGRGPVSSGRLSTPLPPTGNQIALICAGRPSRCRAGRTSRVQCGERTMPGKWLALWALLLTSCGQLGERPGVV